MFMEEVGLAAPLTYRQRWSHYFVVVFALVGVVIGVNLRDSVLYDVSTYVNLQAGIQAQYPRNWLIDTEGSYVFRVRDVSQVGFKTTIQIASSPVGPSTSTRNVVDALTLRRSQTLASYTVFRIESFVLLDEVPATSVLYSYVASEADPFLESIPVVVQGQDVLVVKRGRVLVITFLCDSRTFSVNLPLFEQFLSALEF